MMPTLTSIYAQAPLLQRALVSARPAICPPEPILSSIPANAEVLDVGCGVGALLISLALRGDLIAGTGCDLNPASIAVARSAAHRLANSNLSFVLAGASDDIPPGPFDVVTTIDVMHHVDPAMQRAFFAACAERVKPGGLFVYKDMADKPLWKNLFNRCHDAVLARQFIHYVPLEDIKEWGSALGFTVQEEAAYSRFAYAHELVVFRRGERR